MLPFWSGLKLGLGLIVAIGAQNAFVLRQGLRREHVFAVALFCALSDAVLIALGVSGFAAATTALPWLPELLRWGGVAFLGWYAIRSLIAAIRGGEHLEASSGSAPSLRAVLLTVAAFTWANPHVWLDTVVLLGAVSAQFPGQGVGFASGAILASFVFFFSLAYGARLLAPLFAKPVAWRVLDALIAVLMGSIAWKLAAGAL
ncbi:MAG: amino acid transporter [Thioclava marina]|jgi:Lysine efflux permease|uniref:Amino acid transporter n=1 Tax=Thioclava marina TaxID=1915077 RepID=A0ABX3MN31_9RHOB|nr:MULTISPECIES: LysE/ArgO family amino acid transporter [Thioclava]TNE90609.1 MAG: amino acid transporter [Paracoccaceae bacterium]MBC7145455.1 amino acid transporter [Thioclava marina]MBD3805065.1 amino acid transporter [Thioclava sp.]OOY12954.1 amino acid transporter [Thioclava marina]OOY28179.1 amino acid transporter [Thioclava sp. L04-15]